MGYTTTADQCKYDLEYKIKESIKLCNEFLDTDTWGHDEYTKEYIQKMENVRRKLSKIKELLS